VADFTLPEDISPVKKEIDISPFNKNNPELLESFRSAVEQESSITQV